MTVQIIAAEQSIAQTQAKACSAAEPRDLDLLTRIESALAEPLFEGMPIGPALTEAVVNNLLNGPGKWSAMQRCGDWVNWARSYVRAGKNRTAKREWPTQRILVTWRNNTPRVNEMVLPALTALATRNCNLLYQNENVLDVAPRDLFAASWEDSAPHDAGRWRAVFHRCWPAWKAALKQFCREFNAPPGSYNRLAVYLLNASVHLHGSLEFLRRAQPTAIVTEYDRSVLWSCLVLAARQLHIPTFGMLHGVLAPLPANFRYGLADIQLCWGEYDRENFISAGDDPARLVVTGCPRLSRDVAADGAAVRRRLGLDSERRVVMLGTSPIRDADRLRICEIFCEGVELLENVTGLVRLHPSESLTMYADSMRRHPSIRFIDNSHATLDEAMAATDLVAVQSSGLGSDALVKRRLTVVIDVPPLILGHGQELVDRAGCPRVTTPQELAHAVRAMLFDPAERGLRHAAAERYVGAFCKYFGAESAQRIADVVNKHKLKADRSRC